MGGARPVIFWTFRRARINEAAMTSGRAVCPSGNLGAQSERQTNNARFQIVF